jgi:nitrate/TMAO reductase-like tetraheme cytochrome c subunit
LTRSEKVLLAAIAMGLAIGCDSPKNDAAPEAEIRAPLPRDAVLPDFLGEHWPPLPLPPQGPPPPEFTPAEASLDPQTCGACHPQQFADWKTSLHSAAYSPGLSGQLIEGALAHPAEVRNCLSCHAPLGEQQPYDAESKPESAFDPALQKQGIVCASCHVRAHQRYGPPRRGAPLPEAAVLPHGGFEARTEFQQSSFCAPCHQFFDDAGVAGKPLENTWAEWANSRYAREDRSCQSCHMPDRRHLWRGIHDPETVRAAVDVTLAGVVATGRAGWAELSITNREVGHRFPTYTTPRVFAELWQADAAGREIEGTRVGAVIAREIDFSTSPWSERFDTRVAPDETLVVPYELAPKPSAVTLIGRVTVDPDHHYRGVFASLLGELESEEARARMREAARAVADSAYVLAERTLPIARAGEQAASHGSR